MVQEESRNSVFWCVCPWFDLLRLLCHLVPPTIMFSTWFDLLHLLLHLAPSTIVFSPGCSLILIVSFLIGPAPPIAPGFSPGLTFYGVLFFTWLDLLHLVGPTIEFFTWFDWHLLLHLLHLAFHLVGPFMVLFTWFDWQVPVVRSSHLSQVKAAVQKRLAASNLSERVGTKSQEKPKQIL